MKVYQYIPNPTRCFQCQKFGHGKQSCRGHAKCYRCSEEGHDGLTCDKPVKCSNCNLDHMSSSKEYPVYLKEREIQKIKIEKNISYLDARRQVSCFPWPNFWHWKQQVGFGMYWSTFILYGPTLIVFGIDGDSKVNRYMFNLIIIPCFFYRKSFNICNSLGFTFLSYFLFW
jgi:hypothetical protein